MQALFEKNLIRMKQELTDLKTAHNRGFNTIQFFKHEATFDLEANSTYSFKADIATGEPEWPVWQPFASSPNGLATIKDVRFANQTATRVTWQVVTKNAGKVTTGIIASSVMQGVTQ